MSLCVCVSCFVAHFCHVSERSVCFAVGGAILRRLAVYLLSIRSNCGCTVRFSVEGCPRCYIQGLLCFRAKYELDTSAHEGTLRGSVFCTVLECTLTTKCSRLSLRGTLRTTVSD